MRPSARRRVVIGLGNPDRGDDGAGQACLASLRGRLPGDVELIESDGEPAALLGLLAQACEAYLIDACASGAPPGTVRRFDVAARALPRLAGTTSTHGMGVAEALELARVLAVLPERCALYAIEGRSYAHGRGLSEPVRAAIASVSRRIARAAAS